jgi:hypothetical protein
MKTYLQIALTTLILLLSSAVNINAQTEKLQVILKNIEVIKTDGVVQGYFCLYRIDRVNRKNSLFKLDIYDFNLKLTSSKEIIKPTGTSLTEKKEGMFGVKQNTYFNGTHFCFLFSETDKDGSLKKVYNEIYDKEGNKTGETVRMANFTCIPNKGFIGTSMRKIKGLKGRRVFLASYDNEGKLNWEVPIASHEKAEKLNISEIAHVDNDKIYIINTTNTILFSFNYDKYFTNLKRYMSIIDTKTGKNIKDVTIVNKDHKYFRVFEFDQMLYNKNNGKAQLLFKLRKKESGVEEDLGVFFINFDSNGEIVNESHIGWDSPKYKELKINSFGKLLDDRGMLKEKPLNLISVHLLSDGSKVLIWDIARVEDIIVSTLDPSNKVKDVKLIAISEEGGEGASSKWNSSRNYYEGKFEFVSLNSERTALNISYTEYNSKKANSGSRHSFGNVQYNINGMWKESKIKLNSSPDFFQIIPAKIGYIAVSEYFEKEKEYDFRLEKLDF